MAGSLLEPGYATEKDTQELQARKQRQQYYYNRHAHPFKPLAPGETVRLRLPGQTTWTAGVCQGAVGPRSYEVQVGGSRYRRNRRQLIHTEEALLDPFQGLENPKLDCSGTEHLPREPQVPLTSPTQQPVIMDSPIKPMVPLIPQATSTVPLVPQAKSSVPMTSPTQLPLSVWTPS